jgi:hypothetical protein
MSANRYFAGARRKVRAFAKKDKNAYKKIYSAAREKYRHSFDDIGDAGIRSAIASVKPLTADKDPIIRAHSRGQTDALRAVLAERARKASK